MTLEGRDIRVTYGSLNVLDGVSLKVEDGMWLMLCGPNGAGKSTLVGALSQTVPYTGEVILDGKDAKKWSSRDFARRVGVLSQKNGVSYAFSVEEVVGLGRYAHRKGLLSRQRADDAEKIEQALAITGLSDLRRHSVLTLSGGELQRTFLAQALCQEPDILLLDEPANHLDLSYQEKLFSLIGDWLRSPGRAVVSVVHDLSLARRFGTHALLLDHGRAVESGEIDKVLTRERLSQVYGMDVYAWMRSLLSQWQD